jgi:hypothetical protein
MLRILLFMHHITLCTPCIALLLVSHTYAFYGRSAESKTEIQAEKAPGVFGGPQASRCEDANIVVIKVSPRIPPKSLSFMFEILFIILYTCALIL